MYQKGAQSTLIWEVDPLTCPHCAGEMKLISFVYKKTVLKKILTHLDLYDEQKNQRALPVVVEEYTELVEIVPFDDGWPEYKELLSSENKKKLYQVLMEESVQNRQQKGECRHL